MNHRGSPRIVVLFLAGWLLYCGGDAGKSSDNPGQSLPPLQSSQQEELKLDARLDGRFVKGLQIQPGDWSAIGPQEDIVITFQATGMSGIGQFDIIMEPAPSTTFDMAASVFTPSRPFVTLDAGVEQQGDGRVRLIGVDFNRSTSGDAVLGTLRLRTRASFSTENELRLRLVFFSMGPSSTERDNYEADDLWMGIVVNAR